MDKFANLKAVLGNTRSRVVLIFTALVLVFAVIIGIGLFSHTSEKDQVRVSSAPQISSIVGGFDHKVDPRYAKLLEEQNRRQAARALQTNGTAVPTIINAEEDPTASNANTSNLCVNNSANASSTQAAAPPLGTVCADGTVRDANGKIIGQTGLVAPGGLVYDKNGNIIGSVGPDGQVRDANGNIIGTLGADGTIRDAQGNVIGTTTGPNGAEKPVYDASGKLLGYVGADGKVRDAFGKVIGTVGPDGQVRDASGKVIGSVADSSVGKPVYDASGKLLGYVGADGKVRDASGKVIGTVGADGQVRDASGRIIGKVGVGPKAGGLVYGKNGQVIGSVGADGKVRNANGNVIGTIGPDGQVRDLNGSVIGSTNPAAPGTAVYDAQGRLLGTVGPDGKVRDASGRVVGQVGPDGVVRDASGKPIGRTSYIAPGSAVFGPDGKLLGTIGPDGRLVPANLGPTTAGSSSLTSATETPQEQALSKQQSMLQQQKARQMVLQLQNAMSAQMSLLNSAWAPPTQQYAAGTLPSTAETAASAAAQAAAAAAAEKNAPLVKAGSIMFAVLDTAVNSDEPGPIMATITEGKLKGAKLLGTLTLRGQKIMLTFNTASLPEAPASAAINTVAIDPSTARTGLSSDTNNHYLLRYGTLFASSFMSGYAQALTQSGSQTSYTVDGIVHTYPALDSKQKSLVALGNVGQQYSAVVGNLFNTPPTVKIYAGTGVGILFLSDMATPAGLESSNLQNS